MLVQALLGVPSLLVLAAVHLDREGARQSRAPLASPDGSPATPPRCSRSRSSRRRSAVAVAPAGID